MNDRNQVGAKPAGGGLLPRGMRNICKGVAATAAALSLAALTACSDGGKGKPKPVTVPTNPGTGGTDPGKVVSALDSLVKANKGKGVITGYLSGEGKTIAKGLLKQARNAAGEVRLLTRSEIPLTGATVLIFNAEKPTTVADTTLKTDSTGTYTAALNEGKYFGFAVYLDLETFQLVTTQIPNINPRKDTVVKMDTAIAIEDVTAPTVVGVYDAAAATDGVFLVGGVPATDAKINIVFSEPMNRESAKGVVLGKVDTAASSTSLVLADTVKNVAMTWSGDSKELTLNVASLAEGVQYAVVIPVGLKDLAKNPLESQFKATFAPVKAEELKAIPFGVAATFPAKEGDKDGSLKPIQNPALSFNRPVDVFSVVKGATIEPAHTGFWEVTGARAVFVHRAPFEVGRTYKVTLPASVKDLAGNELGKEHSFSFTVKDFEGAAATATGSQRDIALAVEAMFNAYLAGDIGRFAGAFHANFRMFEGTTIQSKTQFIDHMKAEAGERANMRAGFLAPVFDVDSAACKDGIQRWKVAAQGDAASWLWVESFVAPGSVPRVWDKDRKEIDRAKLAWDRTGPRFTLDGKVYGFAPDFSRFGGGVNMDVARDNGRFMADVMAKTSTIVLEPVKLELKEEFKVDGGMAVSGDTARLAVKLSGRETHSRNNFDPGRSCVASHDGEFFQVLKFMLINDGNRWLVLSIVAPEQQIKDLEEFNRQVDVSGNNFGGANATPITLVSPVNGRDNQAAADGRVAFKFNGVKHDSVGGYIVGLAEDPKFIGGRPPFGLLLFVKASKKDGSEETFSLDASAKVAAGNASGVLRRVHDLRLPGWERTLFEYTLAKLHNPDSGFAGVYQWKVIAVKDTSAAQFLANGFKMDRFLGESDFGPNRGHFAVKGYPAATQFAQFENQVFNQPPMMGGVGGPMGFADSDMDGVMDQMEQKYGTDPRDRNSYPDFRVDSDGDRMADFLEKKLDPEGKDSLADKKADEAGIKAQIAALARLTPPIIIMDGDGDGFPDDVEQMLGFNPMDAFHNPGTRVRANAPSGVFTGKLQMGANTHTLSFKLYNDSAKNLMVAFTAYMGRDTIVDTSRAGFNEIMGEVLMALPLPKNGPDSGRALLLRGNYQAIQSLMMGPVDMIQAVSRTSTSFGVGPYVGQFAASGRGEDVSRYLPGSMTGPMPGPVTGPVAGPAPMIMYRMPPSGTSEGAKIVLGSQIVLIDDFGDTLAVFPTVNWRGQPDGSFELFAETRAVLPNNVMKRSEMGGRVARSADSWVIDGHFRQTIDSAGRFRDIPGQLCAKAPLADLKMLNGAPGLEGNLTGWIAQDKQGTGFSGPAPMPGTTTCPPGTICPPPGGTTGPGTPPPTSFAIPFMGGASRLIAYEKDVLGADEGLAAHVSLAGRVYLVDLDDSNSVSDAKSPWCGQVTAKLSLVPLKEGATEESKRLRMEDSLILARMTTGNLVIFTEAQFSPGRPALLDKARDANGTIVTQVYVMDARPAPFDYGRMGSCGPMTGPVDPNPTCPAGQVCPPPGGTNPGPTPIPFSGTVSMVMDILARSANTVLFVKEPGTAGEKLSIETASVKKDERNNVIASVMGQPNMLVVFLSVDMNASVLVKDGIPVVAPHGAPAGGTTGPTPGGILFLKADLSSVKATLAMQGGEVSTVRDSAGTLLRGPDTHISDASLFFDSMRGQIVGKDASGKHYAFLADGTETNPKMSNGFMVVLQLPPPRDTTVTQPTCPQGQTCPPPNGGTPGDTTKPAFYKGTVEQLGSVLAAKQGKVKVMAPPPALPTEATINPQSIKSDGQLTMAADAGNAARMYIFLGAKEDPTKPFLTQDGFVGVVPAEVMAGP